MLVPISPLKEDEESFGMTTFKTKRKTTTMQTEVDEADVLRLADEVADGLAHV
jgi:hypothetical protein